MYSSTANKRYLLHRIETIRHIEWIQFVLLNHFAKLALNLNSYSPIPG